MAKNPKMTACRNCGAQIPRNAKICPACGAKVKKPFYKRGWFVFLIVVAALIVILSIALGGGKGEKIKWDQIELGDMLPKPKSKVGEILSNTEEYLSVNMYKTSEDDYKKYLGECQALGFTEESEKSGMSYSAYNADGYGLALAYDSGDEKLSIELTAPMDMGTLQWPSSEIAALLPVPKSTVGTVSRDTSDGFLVYVGDTSKEDYNAYVNECSAKGFTVDYNKGDTYYYADNQDGYHLSLSYEGNRVMSVKIEKPEEAPPEETTAPEETTVPEETTAPEETTGPKETTAPEETTGPKETTAPEETTPPEETTEPQPELVNGMRPEFKEAMDSYEAFYDEYCDFMKKYKDNPNDITMLAEYAQMMSKAADMDEKFEAWDEDEMNNAELKYYIEVNSRVAQKLLEVSQ